MKSHSGHKYEPNGVTGNNVVYKYIIGLLAHKSCDYYEN